MRKLSLVMVAAVSVMFVACKKDAKCPYTDSSVSAPQTEIDSLRRYVTANVPAAVETPSGVFYTLEAAGTGAAPDVCSDVAVEYQGYLFNGFRFDGTPTGEVARFTLGGTIEGWRKGIPNAKAGGSITLYIPPSLGYGAQQMTNTAGEVIIPANSYLMFTVNLLEVH